MFFLLFWALDSSLSSFRGKSGWTKGVPVVCYLFSGLTGGFVLGVGIGFVI